MTELWTYNSNQMIKAIVNLFSCEKKDEKQPPEVFRKNRCSYKCRKIRRKTPVPESLF